MRTTTAMQGWCFDRSMVCRCVPVCARAGVAKCAADCIGTLNHILVADELWDATADRR